MMTSGLSILRIAAVTALLALVIVAGWLLGARHPAPLRTVTLPAQTIRLGALQSPVTIAPLRGAP